MKKSILILLLLISGIAYGQNKSPLIQPQKPDTSLYFIAGNINDFKVLFTAIQSPGDVTPNQVKALLNWINKYELIKKPPIDSVKIKK